MSRITAFYITSYENMLDRAKRTFENCFDGDVEFIDFCIDEPTISNGAIEKAKSSDAVWYFAPHFSSASAPLSLIRAKLCLFANVQIVQDGEKEDEYFATSTTASKAMVLTSPPAESTNKTYSACMPEYK